MLDRSVNLTALFLDELKPPKRSPVLNAYTDNCPSLFSGRRKMIVEKISRSISMKAWAGPRIEPDASGSSVRSATDCATWYRYSASVCNSLQIFRAFAGNSQNFRSRCCGRPCELSLEAASPRAIVHQVVHSTDEDSFDCCPQRHEINSSK